MDPTPYLRMLTGIENRVNGKLMRIVTWMSDGNPMVIGELHMSEGGSLGGVIVSQELIKRILAGATDDFVLTPDGYVPEENVVDTVEEAWGGVRERAWNTASALVGALVAEHGLTERRQAQFLLNPGYVESTVEQHVELIQRVAEWLLEV